jgi:hypothetical protein
VEAAHIRRTEECKHCEHMGRSQEAAVAPEKLTERLEDLPEEEGELDLLEEWLSSWGQVYSTVSAAKKPSRHLSSDSTPANGGKHQSPSA